MPRSRPWLGMWFALASPLGIAAQKPDPIPVAVKAPELPSAALLEFVGDWNPDERQLIGMETKAENPSTQKPQSEVRRAR